MAETFTYGPAEIYLKYTCFAPPENNVSVLQVSLYRIWLYQQSQLR